MTRVCPRCGFATMRPGPKAWECGRILDCGNKEGDQPVAGDARPRPPEGNDSDDGFFCDGCSAVIQEAAAWVGNSAYCKDCVGRLCESYFKDPPEGQR